MATAHTSGGGGARERHNGHHEGSNQASNQASNLGRNGAIAPWASASAAVGAVALSMALTWGLAADAALGLSAEQASGAAAAPDAATLPAPLPRRGVLGVRVDAAGREATSGVPVAGVSPGSAAEAAGVQAGDVVVALAGKPTLTWPEFAAVAQTLKEGRPVQMGVRRGEESVALTVTPTQAPKDELALSTVHLGEVSLKDGARLRSMLSVPVSAVGPVACVYFVQGIPCSSIELPPVAPQQPVGPVRALLDPIARAGLAVYRVDKPGCGDSEGGPCDELGFDRELEGYEAGLAALRADPRIDPNRIYIVGASMGGLMAPLMVQNAPKDWRPAGVAVWGTEPGNWFEYLIENTRRQSLLFGADRAEFEANLQPLTEFLARMVVLGQTPDEIFAASPALREPSGYGEDGRSYAGRHARFHHELFLQDLFTAWADVADRGVPTLVMHGEFDWVAGEEGSQTIAEFVNARAPGLAEFRNVQGLDHGMTGHPDLQSSLSNAFQGTVDGRLAGDLLQWIARSGVTRDAAAAATGASAATPTKAAD